MLRRLSVVGDLISLALVGGLVGLYLDLSGRPLSTLDIVLFSIFVPLWPVIGISTRAYHLHSVGRGLSVTISDEFATVFRVTTIWSWFLVVARSLASVEPIQLLPSLLIYAIYGSRGEFLRDQAREALNFQITVLIVYVIARILSQVPPFPSLVLLVWAFSLVFSIIGGMAANRGQRYRYPLTFRFIN